MSAVPQLQTSDRESLIVLTHDGELVESLHVLDRDHDIFTVGSEADLASHLAAEHAEVAIIDAAAVVGQVGKLILRLKSQFPELVLIVAGSVDDQSALGPQITAGTVYRFLHKPVSPQRVQLFVEAAWRRHGQDQFAFAQPGTALSLLSSRRSVLSPLALVGGGAMLGALGLISVWFLLRKPEASPTAQAAALAVSEGVLTGAARDEVLETLLASADRAFAAGALFAPPAANATDLYRQALRRNANDPRASGGLEKVINRLLTAAEAQLLAGHVDAAQQLADHARTIKPDHVRVAFLTVQVAKERERAVLTLARHAAATGNLAQAMAVLDGAGGQNGRSALVNEARQALQQQEVQARVDDYLRRAADRTRQGALIDPAQNNAQFFTESARAIAPHSQKVRQAERQLADRLVGEARKALAAGNSDAADRWIVAVADCGASAALVDSLTRDERRVRDAAKTDALAHLALLFNQRLAQGRIVDPSGDSAKYYLSQLLRDDSGHPSSVLARQAFASRALTEAREAAQRQDYGAASRWLAEAREAGADERSISALQSAMAKSTDVVSASSLQVTRYVAPEFPPAARSRGLSGWVDVQFLVKRDGTTGDAAVSGAEPVGVFEQPALDAVRKWRYQPVTRNGEPVEQLARVRVRFSLEQ